MKRCLALLSAALFSLPALGASVKTVNTKKKTVEVAPDDGETMEKDQTVCIFDEKEKKLGCGNVSSVKDDTVVVKFKSSKGLKKVKEGMAATVSVESLDEGAEESSEADAKKEKKTKGKEKGKKSKKSASKLRPPVRVWGSYGISFAAPATYKKLAYEAPTTETPTTLWASDKAASQTTGFNLQAGIPLGKFSLNPGLRYRTYIPSVVDADYVKQRANPYVSVEEKGSAYGAFVDFAFIYIPFIPQIAFNASTGLDIDMSTVTFSAKKKTDDPTNSPIEGSDNITSMTSKLTVISLRLGTGFDFLIAKVFGLHLGLNLMVPVTESGTISGGFEAQENRGVPDAKADLKKSLAHHKNTFAGELLIGLMLAF